MAHQHQKKLEIKITRDPGQIGKVQKIPIIRWNFDHKGRLRPYQAYRVPLVKELWVVEICAEDCEPSEKLSKRQACQNLEFQYTLQHSDSQYDPEGKRI